MWYITVELHLHSTHSSIHLSFWIAFVTFLFSLMFTLQILHMHIGSIEKLQLTTTGSPLLIRCKTFLFVTFVIPREKECHDIYVTLQKLYQPIHIQNLYCFQYTSSNEELPKSAGWDFFSLEAEFKRQSVPNDRWTLCNLNKTYELCDTCKYSMCIFDLQANYVINLLCWNFS